VSTVIAPGAFGTETVYVKVTDGQGGPTIGVAKVHPKGSDVIADIIVFPACPQHDKPTKVRLSLGVPFPMEGP
jgi:hypothetical protein